MKIVLFVTIALVWNISASSTETPKPINEEVYFHLYTKTNPDNAIELLTGHKLDSKINLSLPWKFFIHGWSTSPYVSPWFHTGKAAYFRKGDYNIVFVDWSKPANQTVIKSLFSSPEVGNFFGKFIIHLSENGVRMNDIHLLGHSMGSHMAGFAGKYVNKNGNKSIGRITGLDPAGPFYEFNEFVSPDYLKKHDQGLVEKLFNYNPLIKQMSHFLVADHMRLAKDDAKFVDVIHTDSTHYGIQSSIGHADFFPNGGLPLQPGCENSTDINCSHAKSVEFFVQSINFNMFLASECKSYEDFINGNCISTKKVLMGEHVDHSARGNFYLRTNAQPPFGQGYV